jgi:hypothetical protein
MLTATMKKTQLMKIMPSLYSGCINMANQAAQSLVMANAFNALVMQINVDSAASAAASASQINMGAIEYTYKQLQHAMQVRFQQLCISQLGKFKKDGIGSNKSNGDSNKMSLGNIEFKETCYHCKSKDTK